MHLDPEDLPGAARPDELVPFRDVPTQAWPRPRLQRHPATADPTRLALEDLVAVAEPTVVTPAVPPPRAVRTGPAPTVQPIPAEARARAQHPSAGRAVGADAAAMTAAVVAALDQAPGATGRIRPLGPGGIFGWRPAGHPTVAEVAEARRRVAEQQERRRLRHARHMDVLEMIRAYLGIVALVLLVLFVGAAALLAVGILAGWYTWMPTH